MVIVAQLVRALDCGSRGRGFEPRHSPDSIPSDLLGRDFFCFLPFIHFKVN
jgi:hypothetical protein